MESAKLTKLAGVRDICDELADAQARDTWVSVAEIATRIGRGETTVRGLLAAGVIPNGKRGSRYYVRRAEFEQWLAGQSNPKNGLDIERLADAVADRVLAKLNLTLRLEPAGPRRM
ncbi:MAG: helix-turn-helix domain-containing protein [Chloroflexi bacterium]|nr:helix-turn-helix domain-containing protein [Chloroflexota bacterium]